MPRPSPAVRGYVLAGGRSSRMGEDKAELRLGGQTLLEIAVARLRPLCEEVVLIGTRSPTPADLRVLPDLHPGSGPLAGIEAALRDLQPTEGEHTPEWALFLPIDMPFLPAGLLCALLGEWRELMAGGIRVAMVQADGRMQPLVSVVHRDLLPAVEQSVTAGSLKVRPLFESAANSLSAGAPSPLQVTRLEVDSLGGGWGGWTPRGAEWRARSLWFGNLNTPEEFAAAVPFAEAIGDA